MCIILGGGLAMKSQHVEGKKRAPALLVIPIANLEEREYPFDFTIDADALELGSFYRGEISIDGSISRVASQYYLSGRITAEQIGECDRCLIETERKVEAEFSLYFQVSGDAPEVESGEESEDAGGIYRLRADEHAIVLDDEIIETLRLAYPMKNLCREDCKGLCSSCGTDLNKNTCNCSKGTIDPRWSKLEGLFPEDTELN